MIPDTTPPPLARDGVHEKVIRLLRDRPRGRFLDIPAGYGSLAIELHKMGFLVACCDINTDQFLIKGIAVDRGDLNKRIPYGDAEFDYVCSTPNYLNIERRLKFLVTGFFTKPVSPAELSEGEIHGKHLSPLGYTLIRFAMEYSGLRIIGLLYDKKKPKQVFLKPLVWTIRLYGRLWSEKKRKRYHLAETTGDVILDGGNTLIIVAQKEE